MSHLSRRGFTMVELLVSLVIMGIVATAIYRVLVNNQRIYQAQTQRIDLSQNIRAAGTIMPSELREADANEGDITTISPTSITFRGRIRPFCRSPTFTEGNLKLGASQMPLEELPTIASAYDNKL